MRLGRETFRRLMDKIKEKYDSNTMLSSDEVWEFIMDAIDVDELEVDANEVFNEIFESEQEIIAKAPKQYFTVGEVQKVISNINKHKAVGWDELD